MGWNKLIFKPQKWAELSRFFSQENELKQADFTAKNNKLNLVNFLGNKTSWIQLILLAIKRAEFITFFCKEMTWIQLIFKPKHELNSADFVAKIKTWIPLLI